jgi:diaminohydroxyphosphoribosylaminopyrimidine deaminase/5-amino-6-(5-phosphoribosylamino)uracil reductase
MRLFDDVASSVHDPFFRHALLLAERGRGTTAPNPVVGCVIVRDDAIVGRGFHEAAGGPHAEVRALAEAGDAARGADIYVTLEPCRHHGRTPPCTDALIAAGVARVFIGTADPTDEAGGGAALLSTAGVTTVFAPDPSPFQAQNEGWITRCVLGRPFVSVKLGVSLDAAVALEPDTRSSMTGAAGRSVTRSLRSRADAVLVGAHTVTVDDPALTVRSDDGSLGAHQPLRVVLVRSELPPADSSVFTDEAAPTLAVTIGEAEAHWLRQLPDSVSVRRLDATAGLAEVLELLGELGIADLLVEPGPRLLASLMDAELVDQLVCVTAGGIAGAGAVPAFGAVRGLGRSMSPRFVPTEAGIVGDVCAVAWRRASSEVSAPATEGI